MEKEIFERIRREVSGNDVVVYLKGSAVFPQCGFSAAMVQVLERLGVAFKDIDVLSDSNLTQALKDFANFPGTPQLYVKGQFVGGADAVRAMASSGELQTLLTRHGILR